MFTWNQNSTRISSFTLNQPLGVIQSTLLCTFRSQTTKITWKYVAELLVGHVNPAISLLYDALKHLRIPKNYFTFTAFDKFSFPFCVESEEISLNFSHSIFSLHHEWASWFLRSADVNSPFLTELFTCPLLWVLNNPICVFLEESFKSK